MEMHSRLGLSWPCRHGNGKTLRSSSSWLLVATRLRAKCRWFVTTLVHDGVGPPLTATRDDSRW
ncbi:hypothetical protein TanjilG_11842 [Lupinus angustifolius]|uniref:Uncharacterized protein n=1 Tax=Lupinus angustifolius TaxID=3871 RepID=A0A394DJJ0_LUPAN|nr:hypothetical protein TanjilG_11842 [Lupinus angustifolius]